MPWPNSAARVLAATTVHKKLEQEVKDGAGELAGFFAAMRAEVERVVPLEGPLLEGYVEAAE